MLEELPKKLTTLPQVQVYLSGCLENSDDCVCVTLNKLEPKLDLKCNHEEADTRMMFPCYKTDEMFGDAGVKGKIIVQCQDVDVLVLVIHHFPLLKNTSQLRIKLEK